MVRTLMIRSVVVLVCGCAGALIPAAGAQAGAPLGAFSTKGALSYVSAPNLHPPRLSISSIARPGTRAAGDVMVSVFKNIALSQPMTGQGGPLILDSQLRPVWVHPGPQNAYDLNLRTQTFEGKPALGWWQGVLTNVGAVTSGEEIVVDQHYKTIATLRGTGGWVLTPHELLISGRDAWVTANKNVSGQNLTALGGPANGTVTDSAVQEYDLKTGKLLYSWAALGDNQIPLSQSQTHPPPTGPWDAYHINSINLVGKTQFLVSMRNTWGAYLVNIATKQIVWTLGGKGSSFTFGPNASFAWQHDVQIEPHGEVSVFDDACCNLLGHGMIGAPSGPSRGLVLKLDTTNHTATLVAQYLHHPKLDTATQGDTQLLPGGDVLVGWGGLPYFSEYTQAGSLLFDASFPAPDISYRAYVFPWVGKPSAPPSGAARTRNGQVTVYASWNGATQVAKWEILAGSSSAHLATVATASKNGFETAVKIGRSYPSFQVAALDAKHHVIGRSKTFKPAT